MGPVAAVERVRYVGAFNDMFQLSHSLGDDKYMIDTPICSLATC